MWVYLCQDDARHITVAEKKPHRHTDDNGTLEHRDCCSVKCETCGALAWPNMNCVASLRPRADEECNDDTSPGLLYCRRHGEMEDGDWND